MDPKSPQIHLNLNQALYKDVQEVASRAGMTIAEYARSALIWAVYGYNPLHPMPKEDDDDE